MATTNRKALRITEREDVLIIPAGWSTHADLVAEIRRTCDPNFVLGLQIQKWATSAGGEQLYGFYSLCRWYEALPEAEADHRVIHADRPSDFPWADRGVVLMHRLWSTPPNLAGRKAGLPDVFREPDQRLVSWCQAAWHEFNKPGTMKSKVEASFRREAAEREEHIRKVQEEARGRLVEDRHILARAIDEGRFVAEKPAKPIYSKPTAASVLEAPAGTAVQESA